MRLTLTTHLLSYGYGHKATLMQLPQKDGIRETNVDWFAMVTRPRVGDLRSVLHNRTPDTIASMSLLTLKDCE